MMKKEQKEIENQENEFSLPMDGLELWKDVLLYNPTHREALYHVALSLEKESQEDLIKFQETENEEYLTHYKEKSAKVIEMLETSYQRGFIQAKAELERLIGEVPDFREMHQAFSQIAIGTEQIQSKGASLPNFYFPIFDKESIQSVKERQEKVDQHFSLGDYKDKTSTKHYPILRIATLSILGFICGFFLMALFFQQQGFFVKQEHLYNPFSYFRNDQTIVYQMPNYIEKQVQLGQHSDVRTLIVNELRSLDYNPSVLSKHVTILSGEQVIATGTLNTRTNEIEINLKP